MTKYRTWGLFSWLLQRMQKREWSLFGALATEDRPLTAWHMLRTHKCLRETRLLYIEDMPSRFSSLTQKKISSRMEEFTKDGGTAQEIGRHRINETLGEISTEVTSFISSAGPNVILDVSALPKRFFFPILRTFLGTKSISNLLVTYGVPSTYAPLNEPLVENFEDWDHLPSFSGEYVQESPELLIISVGFEAMGLQQRFGRGERAPKTKLLFPFPSSPRSFQRAWGFVHRLQRTKSPDYFDISLVGANDVSDAFEKLVSLTEGGRLRVELAPFGPKPIATAMCVFATLTGCPVYYTQPTVYNPRYSEGVSTVEAMPEIYGYCIRLNGCDLYEL